MMSEPACGSIAAWDWPVSRMPWALADCSREGGCVPSMP